VSVHDCFFVRTTVGSCADDIQSSMMINTKSTSTGVSGAAYVLVRSPSGSPYRRSAVSLAPALDLHTPCFPLAHAWHLVGH
jgi:hypothetical protein